MPVPSVFRRYEGPFGLERGSLRGSLRGQAGDRRAPVPRSWAGGGEVEDEGELFLLGTVVEDDAGAHEVDPG